MEPLEFILEKIREAGALLLQAQAAGFSVRQKGGDPRDIVTSADLAVEEFLAHGIRQAYPSDRIYSEESSGSSDLAGRLWVMDPIDGTNNFSRGIPHFSVCLGLLEDGVPTVGAIFNPATRELFHFKKGLGAFLNGQPIRVSTVHSLKDAEVFLHAGRKPELQAWGGEAYRQLLVHAKKSGNFGSSALDICFVAAGRIEANIYGTLTTLDCAPALGLLAQAGGVARDGSGKELAFSDKPQTVFTANNQKILDELSSVFPRLDRKNLKP